MLILTVCFLSHSFPLFFSLLSHPLFLSFSSPTLFLFWSLSYRCCASVSLSTSECFFKNTFSYITTAEFSKSVNYHWYNTIYLICSPHSITNNFNNYPNNNPYSEGKLQRMCCIPLSLKAIPKFLCASCHWHFEYKPIIL